MCPDFISAQLLRVSLHAVNVLGVMEDTHTWGAGFDFGEMYFHPHTPPPPNQITKKHTQKKRGRAILIIYGPCRSYEVKSSDTPFFYI